MINILKNREILQKRINNGYKYVECPFKRLNTVISYEGTISDNIRVIVKEIEECEIEDNNLISKFTGAPIELNKLSDGCKTAIYVYFRAILKPNKHEIINITECGPNAIKYILENYRDRQLNLYLGHWEVSTDTMADIVIDECTEVISIQELLK